MLFRLDRVRALLECANGGLARSDFLLQHVDVLAIFGDYAVAGLNKRFLLGVLCRDFLRQRAVLRDLGRLAGAFGSLLFGKCLADVTGVLVELRLLFRKMVTFHGLLAHHSGQGDPRIAQFGVGIANFLVENARGVHVHGGLSSFVGGAAQCGPKFVQYA